MKTNILFSIPGLFILMAGLQAQTLEDTIKIDEIVVTGSRVEVNRKNMPVNVTVLRKSDIN